MMGTAYDGCRISIPRVAGAAYAVICGFQYVAQHSDAGESISPSEPRPLGSDIVYISLLLSDLSLPNGRGSVFLLRCRG